MILLKHIVIGAWLFPEVIKRVACTPRFFSELMMNFYHHYLNGFICSLFWTAHELTKDEKHQMNFKVACVVKTELFFMEWFYYNLVMLIKWCKIPYKNLGKVLSFSRNQVFCLKIWKLWRAPTTIQFKIFFAETSQTFPIYQCLQKCVRDFLILFRSWVICKN